MLTTGVGKLTLAGVGDTGAESECRIVWPGRKMRFINTYYEPLTVAASSDFQQWSH